MANRCMDVTAAVLAGGLGTRLRSVVADRPKVVAPVGGRPEICYILDQLCHAGFLDVVLLAGYRASQLRETLGERYAGMRLRYSVEDEPLGTAGAVRHALPLLEAPRVLLLNGDSYCDVDLLELYREHLDHARGVTLSVVQMADTSAFGRVRLSDDGQVMRFEEKCEDGGEGWINAGVTLLDRHLIAALPPGPRSLERDVFPDLVRRGEVRGHRCSGGFLDIGTPESYSRAEAFFAAVARHGCPRAA